jgi:hypothetical protein
MTRFRFIHMSNLPNHNLNSKPSASPNHSNPDPNLSLDFAVFEALFSLAVALVLSLFLLQYVDFSSV